MKRFGNLALVAMITTFCFAFSGNEALAKSFKSSSKVHFEDPKVKDSDPNAGNNDGQLNAGEGSLLGHSVPLEFCVTHSQKKSIRHLEFSLEIEDNGDDILDMSQGNNNDVYSSLDFEYYDPIPRGGSVCFTFYVSVRKDMARSDTVTFLIYDQRYECDGDYYEDKDNKIRVRVNSFPYQPPIPPSNSPPKAVTIPPIPNTEKYGSVQLLFNNVSYATGYYLMQSKNNGSYEKVDSSTNPYCEEFKVDLNKEGCYSWYIVATNAYGESEASNVVSTCYQEYVPNNPKQTISITPDTYPSDRLSAVTETHSSVPDAMFYSIKSFCDYRQTKTYETDQLSKEFVTDPGCQNMSWQVAPVVRGSGGAVGIYSDPVYATRQAAPPPVSNHPPYWIQPSRIIQAGKVGDNFLFNLFFYDTVPSKLNVKLIFNGQTVSETNCDSANCVLNYSVVAAYAGLYTYRVVATDSLNGTFDSGIGYFNVLPGQSTSDNRTFKVDPATNLIYFNGLWITYDMFNSALKNIYGASQLLIEETDELNSYRITVMDQAMMQALKTGKNVLFSFKKSVTSVAGKFKNEVWPGFVDRCKADSSSLCVATNIGSSAIPVIEEIQEAASITVNALCFLYEGAVYLATGNKEYVDKMKNSATNVGFASVGILIPFVIDPQMVKAFFNAKDLKLEIADAVVGGAKVVKMDALTITLKEVESGLRKKGYWNEIISETSNRIRKLKSPEMFMREENYSFLAELGARAYGPEKADFLIEMLQDLEVLKVESTRLPLKFLDGQTYSLSKIEMSRFEKIFGYNEYLRNKTVPPNFKMRLNKNPDFGNFKGEVKVMKTRMYFDMMEGAKKFAFSDIFKLPVRDCDDYVVIRKNNFSEFSIISKEHYDLWVKGNVFLPQWDKSNFGDFDIVRQFGNELWLIEVKASDSLPKTEEAYAQLIKMEKAISYWKSVGLIPDDMVVRRIAVNDKLLDELYPDETSGYIYGETKSAIKKFVDDGGTELTISK